MKKYLSAVSFLAMTFCAHDASAQTTCNSGNPWVTQWGTMTIGDQMIYGPNCNTFQDGGNPALGNASVLYVDTSGNDNNTGTQLLPLRNANACISKAQSQVLSKNVVCIFTAGQIFTDTNNQIITLFWGPINQSGEIFFQSSIPGTAFTLRCPPGGFAVIQVGDGGILIDQDTIWDSNFNSCPHTVQGHNFGVMDTFSNVTFLANNGDLFFTDFDFHFNVNGQGFRYSAGGGTITRLFNLGPGTTMDVQGPITNFGITNLTKPFSVSGAGAQLIIEGNVSWNDTGTLTAATPGEIGGNGSVINRINAQPPGGAPTPIANNATGFGSTGWYSGLAYAH